MNQAHPGTLYRGVYDQAQPLIKPPSPIPLYMPTTMPLPCSNYNSGYPQPQMMPPLGRGGVNPEPLFGNKDNMKYGPHLGGNWSRGRYDEGTLEIDTRQSTAPLEYLLDPNYAERCNQCFATGEGWIAKQGVSYDTSKPLVDTESELFQLNRLLTKDPNYRYLPSCPQCNGCDSGLICGDGFGSGCAQCQPKLFNFAGCGSRFEFSRLSNPTCTLKESGVNRFDIVCLNPQDPTRWEVQGEVGICSRMVFVDNSVPCVPVPLDDTSLRPIGGDVVCQLTTPTCGAYASPMHNLYIA